MSSRLAGALAAAVAAAVVLMPGASQAAAAPRADSASTSQRALLNAMGRLDRRLAKTIAKSKAGKKTETYLSRRSRDNLTITDKFMFRPINGVKASGWFRQLACVDLALTKAGLRESGKLKRGNKIDMLANAAACGQGLQRELGDNTTYADIAAFNGALVSAIATAQAGNAVAPLIGSLQGQSLGIVDRYMQRPVYGVKANEWFRQLSCVNRELALAKLRERKSLRRGSIRTRLRNAKRCARTLAAQLKSPAAQNNPAGAIIFGSNSLTLEPQRLTGYFNEDAEYWLTKLAPQPPAANYVSSTTAPEDGVITEFKVRGYAVRGPYPKQPISSLPIRFSVARPQPNGTLKVITTTDPAFTMPATDGIWIFSTSQLSFVCCRVQKGDVVSFNARNGEFAVTARVLGSITDTFTEGVPDLPTMNPGYTWTGTPHPDVELLMQVTEQPDG